MPRFPNWPGWVCSMIPLHYGGQKSSIEIPIVITETVPTRADDQILQTPSLCFSPQGGRSGPSQIPVVVINGLWLDFDAHAIPTGWVFMLERMLTAGPM